jgi:hypothetical protein
MFGAFGWNTTTASRVVGGNGDGEYSKAEPKDDLVMLDSAS